MQFTIYAISQETQERLLLRKLPSKEVGSKDEWTSPEKRDSETLVGQVSHCGEATVVNDESGRMTNINVELPPQSARRLRSHARLPPQSCRAAFRPKADMPGIRLSLVASRVARLVTRSNMT